MKNLISILFLIIGFQSLSPQALVTSVDNDTIIIGNNVKYIIKLENDKEELVVFPDSTSFTSLEYVSDEKIDTVIENNKSIYSKKYDLTSFDEGSFIIPKMSVMVGDQILLTESKTIQVNLVEVDTLKQGLYEIKPIYEDIKYFNNNILHILLVENLHLTTLGQAQTVVEQKRVITIDEVKRELEEMKRDAEGGRQSSRTLALVRLKIHNFLVEPLVDCNFVIKLEIS